MSLRDDLEVVYLQQFSGVMYDADEADEHYDEICETQLHDVFYAWLYTGNTDLSEALYLHHWVLARRLYELGLGPQVGYPECRRYGS